MKKEEENAELRLKRFVPFFSNQNKSQTMPPHTDQP